MQQTSTSHPNAHTAIVIGLGAIGSHLVPHLARMPWLQRLVLIDPDVYGESNRRSQAATVADMGRAKTAVQQEVVRRIDPELCVAALPFPVEDVPLGWLRGDVILTCLDSRVARQYVNEAARCLGVPWVDAGVEPGSWLVRVNVYEPGRDASCLECAWDQRDYDALPQRYPCSSDDTVAPTAAPSSLGALAGSLQALECQKLLTAERPSTAGAQVLVDARSHTLLRTVMPRNPTCRLAHADPIEITDTDMCIETTTVHHLLFAGGREGRDGDRVQLRVPMHAWAGRLVCGRCGHVTTGHRLRRSGGSAPACPTCDDILTASGFDVSECLEPHAMTPTDLSRTLDGLGLRHGDVVAVETRAQVRYLQFGITTAKEQRS